ncbi:MAG: hypothetical protein AAGB93_04190 [Planctomycetota bacterium]
MTTPSRCFHDLRRPLQTTVLRVCLSEDDLGELGFWDGVRRSPALSPGVLNRSCLRRACMEDPRLAQVVTDHLDLKYLDTLVLVASLDRAELESMVRAWCEDPVGRALPGLLWSLLSDGRKKVHALGVRLQHEAEAIALDRLVGGSDG